jgi:hypothetical protein
MPTPRRTFLSLGILAALALPASAEGSVKVAGDARNPAFRVNAAGYATVSWTSSWGTRRIAYVNPRGRIRYGRGAPGRDVSYPSSAVALPMLVALRGTPDGRFWALQAWRRIKTGPVELRLSRWRGAPTLLTLRMVCCKWRSEVARGNASFHGRPIYGFRATPSGVALDRFGRNVYIDSWRGGEWKRTMGLMARRPTGWFGLWIRPHWRGSQYRARMVGPNWGRSLLGPDAEAWAPSAL